MYRFSSEFQRWVREQNRDGARSLTEAGNLKGEMFGTMSKPQFKFKAGELASRHSPVPTSLADDTCIRGLT